MEETNNKTVKFMLNLNEFHKEIIKSMNYIRGDINELKDELKGDINELRDELKGDINELRDELKGEVNDLRQELRDYKEENNKRWDANDKKWEKYEANRKGDRKFLLDTLVKYDLSISEQLGDTNVEKMRKIV